MIELTPVKHPSTIVHSIGFDGDERGDIHVQFQSKDGKPTVRGYYKDVQRAIFNWLTEERKPGSFINQYLKSWFEWVPLKGDPTLPDMLFIPASVLNDQAAIDACIDSQRIVAQPKRLFG